MPRRHLIKTAEHPYHVTIRCNNKEWFDQPLHVVWNICLSALKKADQEYPVDIFAFVLMSNHYHLVVRTPNLDLDKFMFELNRHISKGLRQRTGRINRIFGDRYHWTVIEDNQYFHTVLRYVFENPLRAGIVKRCEDYRFSTLRYLVQEIPFPIPLESDFARPLESFLSFVNRDWSIEARRGMSKALRRTKFRPPVEASSRRQINLS